jgi:hypothetical protein
MKRIIQSFVLTTLISTAQVLPFPAGADVQVGLPAGSTYADRYAGQPDVQTGSAIPAGAEDVASLSSEPTHADRCIGEGDTQMGSAFPVGAELST